MTCDTPFLSLPLPRYIYQTMIHSLSISHLSSPSIIIQCFWVHSPLSTVSFSLVGQKFIVFSSCSAVNYHTNIIGISIGKATRVVSLEVNS